MRGSAASCATKFYGTINLICCAAGGWKVDEPAGTDVHMCFLTRYTTPGSGAQCSAAGFGLGTETSDSKVGINLTREHHKL
jgi:hypothetical protein